MSYGNIYDIERPGRVRVGFGGEDWDHTEMVDPYYGDLDAEEDLLDTEDEEGD